eukprot:6994596-Pyramimonas_sp.AAC.2
MRVSHFGSRGTVLGAAQVGAVRDGGVAAGACQARRKVAALRVAPGDDAGPHPIPNTSARTMHKY